MCGSVRRPCDEHKGYDDLERHFKRGVINHERGQYVDGDVTTNSIESFWAPFKRAYKGTLHYMSEEHLQRYVNEFVAKNNLRGLDTDKQMEGLVNKLRKKRLTWKELTS